MRDTRGRFCAHTDAQVVYETSEPVRAQNIQSDVVVPILQSFVTCAGAGIVVTLLNACGLLSDARYVAVLTITMCGTFVLALLHNMRVARSTLFRTSVPLVLEYEDDEGDDEVQTIRVELTEIDDRGQFRRMRILDLPIDDERLRIFARAALENRSLAVHRWTPTLFTRSEYEVLTDELRVAGLLTVSRTGRHLTRAGRHVLKRLVDR